MPKALEIQHVDPSTLRKNPWNSNVVGPDMEARLDESLRRFSVYKPIIVRSLGSGELEIIGGQHRAESAVRVGVASVPIINLGPIPDARAKAIGLADNGRYGEDDPLRLADIIKELGSDDVALFLPFNDQDLAGILASDSINLDDIELKDGGDDEEIGSLESVRPTVTDALMRFKVPLADHDRVKALVDRVVSQNGYDAEADSLLAVGMALVVICNAAKDVL